VVGREPNRFSLAGGSSTRLFSGNSSGNSYRCGIQAQGVSQQKIGRVMPVLRSSPEQPFHKALNGESCQFILTDGYAVLVEQEPQRVAQRIVDAMKPVYVINLAEQVKRLNSAMR
jgi:hypothetical protein